MLGHGLVMSGDVCRLGEGARKLERAHKSNASQGVPYMNAVVRARWPSLTNLALKKPRVCHFAAQQTVVEEIRALLSAAPSTSCVESIVLSGGALLALLGRCSTIGRFLSLASVTALRRAAQALHRCRRC